MPKPKLSPLFARNAFVALFFFAAPMVAAAIEGIVFDPQSGNYTITYESEPDQYHQTVFVPATKIHPVVESEVKGTRDGNFLYRYTLHNGKNSQQSIVLFYFISGKAEEASARSPRGWSNVVVSNYGGFGYRISWLYRRKGADQGLAPGEKLEGFEIISALLPGLGVMRIMGATPIVRIEGPGLNQKLSEQLGDLQDPEKNSVLRPVAVPLFAVASPFNASALLSRIRKHVQDHFTSTNQIDPVFAAQLGRLFQAAIDAINQGNLVAARGEIRELRRLLHREHKGLDEDEEDRHGRPEEDERRKDKSGLITRLAARVLEFDLKYVENRLNKGDHGD